MIKSKQHMLQEVSRKEILPQIRVLNPELAEIIANVQLNDKHKLYLVKYPYGVNIIDQGTLFLPHEGRMIDIDSYKKHTDIQLSAPFLGLALSKSIEIYVERDYCPGSIPFKLFEAGTFFGVWELMPQTNISQRSGWSWKISSGAKTTFLLPKISAKLNHQRLQREFRLKNLEPNSLFEHQDIFKNIAAQANSDWQSEVLFFSKEWLKPQTTVAWYQFKDHLTSVAWRQMHYWSNKIISDFNWEIFMDELHNQNIKPDLYLLDSLKHLIAIACGTIPGFAIANGSETIAPTKLIQAAYTDIYGLKNYAPIIMHPALLDESNYTSVFYSLQLPTLPERPSEFKELPSGMKLLRSLRQLLELYLNIAKDWPHSDGSGNSYDLLENIQFDYFHNSIDQDKEIQTTNEMLNSNANIKATLNQYSNKEFPTKSTFFRGCIHISLKY